ncbi:uncharacterized protein LOC127737430 [Mytilus californianus]|uniref:uncharacterized protein LOC127737430 n=1 Tax=Mytilus californianus TaxID=6549 RepID=UPI002247700B|nr:uncharacterized protein LOC127737430 [Mytilus californianus]
MWRTHHNFFTVLMVGRYRSHIRFETIIRSIASACFTQTSNRGLTSQRICTTQENPSGCTSKKERYVPVYKTMLKCHIREMSTEPRNSKIDSVLQKIVESLEIKGEEVTPTNYAELRNKLVLLVNYGCDIHLIPKHIDIFDLSSSEIQEQGERLKAANMSNLTPDLFLTKDETIVVSGTKKLTLGKKSSSRDEILRKKLKCTTQTEWHQIKKHFPYKNTFNCTLMLFVQACAKVDLLLEFGLSTTEIKNHPQVLSKKITSIQQRIEWIKKTCPFVNNRTRLELLKYNYRQMEIIKMQLDRYSCIWSGCQTKQEVVHQLQEIAQHIQQTKNSVQQILQEIENIGNVELKEEHIQLVLKGKRLKQLKEKLIFFLQLGISIEDIVENILCVVPKLKDIQKTVNNTKESNVHEAVLIPQIMKKQNSPALTEVDSDMHDLSPVPKLKDSSIVKYGISELKDVLPLADLEELQNIVPVSKWKSSIKIIQFLLSEGYSVNDIRCNPQILQRSMKMLTGRLDKVRQVSLEVQPSVDLLTVNPYRFRSYLKDLEKYRRSLGKSTTKTEKLSQSLDLNKSQTMILDPILHLKLDDLKARINYLEEIGISKDSIANDIFCLGIPVSRLKEVVKELKEDGNKKITLMQITEHAAGDLETGNKNNGTAFFIRDKLGMLSIGQWDKIQIQYLNCSTVDVEKNFKLLIENGFTAEIMKTCPYILGHSCAILEEYLGKVEQMQASDMYQAVLRDKVKLLNVLQYMIEQDHNFQPVVNDKTPVTREEAVELLYFK